MKTITIEILEDLPHAVGASDGDAPGAGRPYGSRTDGSVVRGSLGQLSTKAPGPGFPVKAPGPDFPVLIYPVAAVGVNIGFSTFHSGLAQAALGDEFTPSRSTSSFEFSGK